MLMSFSRFSLDLPFDFYFLKIASFSLFIEFMFGVKCIYKHIAHRHRFYIVSRFSLDEVVKNDERFAIWIYKKITRSNSRILTKHTARKYRMNRQCVLWAVATCISWIHVFLYSKVFYMCVCLISAKYIQYLCSFAVIYVIKILRGGTAPSKFFLLHTIKLFFNA